MLWPPTRLLPRSFRRPTCVTVLLLLATHAAAGTETTPFSSRQILQAGGAAQGWWLPSTGPFTGHFEGSVSLRAWSDRTEARNLQLRGLFNLPQGLRVNAVLRSNRELGGIGVFEPVFDELYLESRGYHFGAHSTFSYNLRYGRMRYLRFPFPDRLSLFDLVPGMEDLEPDPAFRESLGGAWREFRSSLNGALLNIDTLHARGFGHHASLYLNSTGDPAGIVQENYLYHRHHGPRWEWELRAGQLQWRDLPEGLPADPTATPRRHARLGGNAYLGLQWRGLRLGFMLERVRDDDLFAGILLQLSPHPVTNVLGTFHVDYTRVPEGIALHLPLLRGQYGYARTADLPAGARLVGEVRSERRSTFWGSSQTRNFFEHEAHVGGRVAGEDLIVVCDEDPWYLRSESPVGRLEQIKGVDDVRRWDSSSARLGEVAQPVVYRYYAVDGPAPRKRLQLLPLIDFDKLLRR